jgi:mRNA interferase HigB
MRIVSHKKLRDFYKTTVGREDSRVALERWYDIVEKAEWKNLTDIKADFSSVDYVGNQRYIFNIKGNKYRLVVVIKFSIGYIYIRFVGTHEESVKIDCSTI